MDGIAMRLPLPEDEAFLYKLFISSRPDLQGITGISEDMRETIYRQQYLGEKLQLDKYYSAERFNIVLYNGNPAGRFYVYSWVNGIRVVAIALIPEYRNLGIGRYLMNEVLKEAVDKSKPVFLQVAWYNYFARSFYEKLGFYAIEDNGVYCEMKWEHK